MAGSLGTISGQVKLDVTQALAAFAATRAAGAEQVASMDKAGKSLVGVGAMATGAGLALVAGFGVAIEAAAKFDQKMSYVQGITHATGDEMEQVRAKALQLGKDGQFSAGQIADGFVDLAKAGVPVTDMTHGMADAMTNLASASSVSLSTAVEDIIAQLHTYNLSSTEASHVSDEMAGAMHASVLSLDDISSSMKYAGSVAHTLGISFDSTAEATAILGKAGIKGSSAGTQLRQIMVSLAGATKPAKKELQDLGIITKDGTNQFFDATGKAKDLSEVFQILQDHTKGLNDEQRVMAFRTIFNNRALSAAAVLTASGAKGFEEMNAQIGKTTAAEVASKRLDNLKGDLQKLKGSLDTLLIQVGEPFQNMLRGWVQNLNKLVNVFVGLSPHTQKLVMEIVAILGVALTLGGTFLVFAGTALKAVKTIRETYAAFKFLASGIRIVMVAVRSLSVALLTSPIFWIVVAIIAVGAAFYYAYTHSKTFRDIINAIGKALKTAFIATIEWFKGLPKFFEDLWKDIQKWFTEGVDWVKKHWNSLVTFFTTVNKAMVDAFIRFGNDLVNFLRAIPGEVVGFLKTAWHAFEDFMLKLPERIGFAIGYLLGALIRFGIDAYQWATKLGDDVTKTIGEFFEKLPGRVWDFLVRVTNKINDFSKYGAEQFVKFGNDVVNSVNDFFSKLPGRVEGFLTDMYHKAVKLFSDFIDQGNHFSLSVFNGVVDFFSKLPGRIGGLLSDMYNTGVKQFESFLHDATEFGKGVYNTVHDFFSKLPGTIGDILGNCVDAFKSVVSQAFNAAKDFGSGLWNGFKKGLGINSPSYLEKAMWAITKVTDTETKRLGGHVKQMQVLAGQMSATNPAKTAAAANTQRIVDLTNNMKQQATLLQGAAAALTPTAARLGIRLATGAPQSAQLAASQTAQDALLGQRPINITVNNPVAEQASDSAARKLRTLTAMGAF